MTFDPKKFTNLHPHDFSLTENFHDPSGLTTTIWSVPQQ
jgi:hypothetical protein